MRRPTAVFLILSRSLIMDNGWQVWWICYNKQNAQSLFDVRSSDTAYNSALVTVRINDTGFGFPIVGLCGKENLASTRTYGRDGESVANVTVIKQTNRTNHGDA